MATRTRRKAAQAPAPVVEREPLPPAPPLPDWFSPGPPTQDNRRSIRTFSELAYKLVEQVLAGKFALPAWQRPPVWSREQQVLLLDTLVRGWPCGSLLVWDAPRDAACAPLAGVGFESDAWGHFLVLDGQQRLTALVAAARGDLDVRWDGERWGPTGYLDARMCFGEPFGRSGWWDYNRRLHDDHPETWEACIRAWENVHRAEVQVTIVKGDEEDAREAYRRFNGDGAGVAHTVADLARAEKPGSPQVATG